MNRRTLAMGVLALTLAGCGGAVDTSTGDPNRAVYVMSAAQADAVMRAAMQENFTRQPITNVSVPHRGYSSEVFFALDRHAITLYAVPASGRDASGRRVDGFYFEARHFGSMPLTGSSRSNSVMQSVRRLVEGRYPQLPLA